MQLNIIIMKIEKLEECGPSIHIINSFDTPALREWSRHSNRFYQSVYSSGYWGVPSPRDAQHGGESAFAPWHDNRDGRTVIERGQESLAGGASSQ